jgi:hypothetical protein
MLAIRLALKKEGGIIPTVTRRYSPTLRWVGSDLRFVSSTLKTYAACGAKTTFQFVAVRKYFDSRRFPYTTGRRASSPNGRLFAAGPFGYSGNQRTRLQRI